MSLLGWIPDNGFFRFIRGNREQETEDRALIKCPVDSFSDGARRRGDGCLGHRGLSVNIKCPVDSFSDGARRRDGCLGHNKFTNSQNNKLTR